MEYALIFHEAPAEFARRASAEAPAYWGAWSAYIGAMREAGIMRGGAGLEPPTTSTVLRKGPDGHRQVQDGPFAGTKEQLGGFLVIEVPDLEAALAWAARCPAGEGSAVELRPTIAGPMPA